MNRTRDHVPRILIVDDELTNRQLLEIMLSQENLVLESAGSGQEALAHVARHPPDLILLDVRMPGMDGYEVATKLKSDAATRTIPIIMVTVRDDREARMRGLHAGAEDFLSKPVDRAELCVRVRNLLRLKAYSDYHDRYRLLLETEVGSRTADLAQTEARYRQIVETTNEGIWQIDGTGTTIFLNTRMAEMLGYQVGELVGRSYVDLVYEDGIAQIDRNIAIMRAGGRAPQAEVRFKRHDNAALWTLLEMTPIASASGLFEGVLGMMMDITARKKTEEARDEAELRFRRLYDSGIIGVTVTDQAGAMSEANGTFLDLLGYTQADVTSGRMNWRTLSPDVPPNFDRIRMDLETRGSTTPWEKEYLHRSGTRVPVLVGVAALDAERNITVVTDLTARKRAEERKTAVVNAAFDAVVVMDPAGAITEFNPAAERMFGVAAADAMGLGLSDLVTPPRPRADAEHGIENYYEAGADPTLGVRRELCAIARDDRRFPVELSISPMSTGAGFVGFIRDISDRKQAEHTLLERMQVAAMGADVGVALTSGESLGAMLERCVDAIVKNIDAAFVRIWTFDATTKQLVSRATVARAPDVVGPEVAVKMFDVDGIVHDRVPYVTNAVLDDPRLLAPAWARRERLQAFAGYPLVVEGELVGILAMFARAPLGDVVLRGFGSIANTIAIRIRGKLAESSNLEIAEQLRQSQKMDAVGRLAGGVAHDFNNLLSVVLSYADFAIEDLSVNDPMRGDIEQIREAGLRAADLTRQLLMFSRQQVIEPKVLDLNEVLAGMDKMLRRILGEDVVLTSVLGPSLRSVRADPGSIEQVIMNLVINARDAMPTGGKITMETANVVLDDHFVTSHLGVTAGDFVMVSVTDTGCGMDKATRARIFEPFFTTKASGKGTGLGLSTVFGITQQSGGTVWVYSEVGIGTTFKVYLPQVDGPADTARTAKDLGSGRGTETVLLVEDEDQVRDVARGILRRHGYVVLEARNGGEALLLCEQRAHPIDILVSDVVMPGMSGPELAKRLALGHPEMKVLCMSGYTDDAAVRHGVIDAHFAYLQKPFTVETLTRKVREVLDA